MRENENSRGSMEIFLGKSVNVTLLEIYILAFLQSGSISVNETSFSASEYCLEISEGSVNDSEHQWNVMICDDSEVELYVRIHLISTSSKFRRFS